MLFNPHDEQGKRLGLRRVKMAWRGYTLRRWDSYQMAFGYSFHGSAYSIEGSGYSRCRRHWSMQVPASRNLGEIGGFIGLWSPDPAIDINSCIYLDPGDQ